VREFQVELRQTHNDTTTVTFAGAYQAQHRPRSATARRASPSATTRTTAPI
jgi:hypothetical protein